MFEIIITALAAGAAGVLAQAWRTSRATGKPLLRVIINRGVGEE